MAAAAAAVFGVLLVFLATGTVSFWCTIVARGTVHDFLPGEKDVGRAVGRGDGDFETF